MHINVSILLHDTNLFMITVYELSCKRSVLHTLTVPLTSIISLVSLCNCVYYFPLVINYVDLLFLHSDEMLQHVIQCDMCI